MHGNEKNPQNPHRLSRLQSVPLSLACIGAQGKPKLIGIAGRSVATKQTENFLVPEIQLTYLACTV
jgi:hypothetical protein